MKNVKKALLVVLCVVLLVVSSVFGTLAYLTDKEAVVNTFTVGQIDIYLDEGKVDEAGAFIDQANDRVQENKYHLIPGQSYDKDPTVKVLKDSEDAWLFVKVENNIALIEAAEGDNGYRTIANQLTDNGWVALDGVKNVYYQAHPKSTASDTYFTVFKNFKIAGDKVVNGTPAEGEVSIDSYNTAKNADSMIKVTAYAIQKAGFDSTAKTDDQNAAEAWTALVGQLKLN